MTDTRTQTTDPYGNGISDLINQGSIGRYIVEKTRRSKMVEKPVTTPNFDEKAELLAFQAKRFSMDVEYIEKIKPLIKSALEKAYQEGRFNA